MRRCASGKRGYETYADALAALVALEASGQMRGPFGAVYTCPQCALFHISSRRFTIAKRKGRGKSRRSLVIEEGA
jgi:hypothetical protein